MSLIYLLPVCDVIPLSPTAKTNVTQSDITSLNSPLLISPHTPAHHNG